MTRPSPAFSTNPILLLLVCLFCTNCTATSRMGRGEVIDRNGTPCFTVPESAETHAGVPLYSILVSETRSSSPDTLPTEFWHVNVQPSGQSVRLLPSQCIEYGQLIPSTAQRTFKPLQPFQIYAVHLNARPAGSNLMGYSAEFCIVANANKVNVVHVIPPGEANSPHHQLRCSNSPGQSSSK